MREMFVEYLKDPTKISAGGSARRRFYASKLEKAEGVIGDLNQPAQVNVNKIRA